MWLKVRYAHVHHKTLSKTIKAPLFSLRISSKKFSIPWIKNKLTKLMKTRPT